MKEKNCQSRMLCAVKILYFIIEDTLRCWNYQQMYCERMTKTFQIEGKNFVTPGSTNLVSKNIIDLTLLFLLSFLNYVCWLREIYFIFYYCILMYKIYSDISHMYIMHFNHMDPYTLSCPLSPGPFLSYQTSWSKFYNTIIT